VPAIILLRPIGMHKFALTGIRRHVEAALKAEAEEQVKQMQKPTSTWKGDKPKFVSIVIKTADQIGAHTYPDVTSLGGKKFMWLDEGTSVRWALMSGNWRSKTRVGSWKSGAGAGRVLFAGKKAFKRRKMQPRPGIKARRWTKMAHKERTKPFRDRMVRVFKVYAAGWRKG